jgi:hypothetical protein
MNEHDQSNLDFLLSVDPKTFKDWYGKMGEEDHDYAMELLAAYSKELDERALALRIDCELELMDKTMPDAQKVLARFLK